jgi:N-acetylmuramic acid 6-phosphate etherase
MDHLLTEARNAASLDLDSLTPIEIVRLMNAEDAKVPAAVAAQAEPIARAIEIIADRLRAGGRLVYVGAGTSGRLGVLDASECPPTFNSPPGQVVGLIAGGPTALTTAVEGAEDHPEFAQEDLKGIALSGKDVLVGIATSGRTPYVIGAMRHARSVGAFAIGLACVPDAELAAEADLMITPIVGPEVLTGSTRLKAGTATKLVLNTLTTGAMVRLGKTYGNLMVDLRATNLKLKARTNRIVRQFLGVSVEEADALLAQCGGELKTALVVGRTELSPEMARQRLADAGGRIVDALTESRLGTAYPSHILGIDGGGTHCHVLLAVVEKGAARSVGRGEGGPSNVTAEGPSAAFAEIDRAVEQAFTNANLPRGPVGAACLGLAGAGRAEAQAVVRKWAKRIRLANSIEVVGDVALPVALLPDNCGVVVVAGTGSCVWGRAADGRTARAGGWGPILSDEGSGYAMVLAALRAITRAEDRRAAASSLADRLLQRMGLRDATQLAAAIHGGEWDRARLAAMAEEVIRAADEGDDVATEIVSQGAADLAGCIAAVIGSLPLPRDGVSLALAGGLLLNAATYRDRMLMQLKSRDIRPGLVLAVSEPAEGALRIAMTLLPRSQ